MSFSDKIKFLGIYQLVGGLIGVWRLFFEIFNTAKLTIEIGLLISSIFILFLFSIYCGYLVLKGNLSRGLQFSIYNQTLQIIGFAVLGFSFFYVSGIFVVFHFDFTFDTIFSLKSGFSTAEISLNNQSKPSTIILNILGFILLNFTHKLQTIYKNQ